MSILDRKVGERAPSQSSSALCKDNRDWLASYMCPLRVIKAHNGALKGLSRMMSGVCTSISSQNINADGVESLPSGQ